MSDEKKPTVPLEPEPAPPKAGEKPTTLAVHDDRMWGGTQRVYGLPDAPVVSSKKQYFELLNAAGLRIKNQQESSTGPERPVVTPEPLPAIDVPPMTMEEAHVYGAITAVLRHYDLLETIWCDDCARRARFHGCRMHVSATRVLLACRCGHAIYTPPVGTTDLVLSKLPNIARTQADTTTGTVLTAAGPVTRPTAILHDMEALIVRRYIAALTARHKEPRVFHRACYAGNPTDEENALAIGTSPQRLVLLCQCRTLYHQQTRVISPRPLRVM